MYFTRVDRIAFGMQSAQHIEGSCRCACNKTEKRFLQVYCIFQMPLRKDKCLSQHHHKVMPYCSSQPLPSSCATQRQSILISHQCLSVCLCAWELFLGTWTDYDETLHDCSLLPHNMTENIGFEIPKETTKNGTFENFGMKLVKG